MSVEKTEFKRWRERMGIKQTEAAKALGVTYKAIQEMELGYSRDTGKPRNLTKLWRIAMAAHEAAETFQFEPLLEILKTDMPKTISTRRKKPEPLSQAKPVLRRPEVSRASTQREQDRELPDCLS